MTAYSPNDKMPPYDALLIGEACGLRYYRYVEIDRDGAADDGGDWQLKSQMAGSDWEWTDPPD